jgi:hypothetical protein
MNDILIVTGTCGVGKSSICWRWANLRQGAAINCDMFRIWIRNTSLQRADNFQEHLLAKHACALAKDYLAMGLDVAIDNVWTPKGLQFLQSQLSDRARINVFWLNCSPEENHRRDQLRSSPAVMGERVSELQKELEGMNWPDYVRRLDTTGLSVDQTIARIENSFQQDGGTAPSGERGRAPSVQ